MHITWIPINEHVCELISSRHKPVLHDSGAKEGEYSWAEYAIPHCGVPLLRYENHAGDPFTHHFIASYETGADYNWENTSKIIYEGIAYTHDTEVFGVCYDQDDGKPITITDSGFRSSAIPLVRSECTPDHVGCLFFIAVPVV